MSNAALPEIIDLAVELQWTDNALLNLALTWIEEQGHTVPFTEYLLSAAAEGGWDSGGLPLGSSEG